MRLSSMVGLTILAPLGLAGLARPGLGRVCAPNPRGTACEATDCLNAGDECRARCARYDPFTGETTISQCECMNPDQCQLAPLSSYLTPACAVPDNGSGTADLPPTGCTYVTPADDMRIVDGLPPGTTVEIDASQSNFSCPGGGAVCSFPTTPGDCRDPGGSLGGEKSCTVASLSMPMTGTGSLAGFNRNIVIPISLEIHSAPKTNGMPTQSFATGMFRLFGQITSDPDFDLLRVTAGTDFGLPSPGHTTLTQLPGGNWAVDSFFDITYRIDFVGAPGGPLAGMSGSTTGTVRFQTGAPLPGCQGNCPPGTECKQVMTANPDGSLNVCCECVEPPVCEPNPAGTDCLETLCPTDGERCRPKCTRYDPQTGQSVVTQCECVNPEQCHAEPGGPGVGCTVPDNGSGTVDLPPAGCTYTTPDDDMRIVDGLPAGTTVEIDASQSNFSCPGLGGGVCSFPTTPADCRDPGGSLGGEKSCADASLSMPMVGTGSLAGFNRNIVIPISLEIHSAPKTNGMPTQSFATGMFRLFGQITSDPDFDLLRVTAGTDFGLPSPGHTTLTQLPGGNWAVDSFFDITYRIDFVGAPGGPLAGMSGSTTGTVRFRTGSAASCVGLCPPGTECRRNVTVNPDGTLDICCECVPIPCEPNPTGTACNPAQCPIEGEECRPRCARLNPFTGLYEVVACECVDPNSCHLEMTGGSGQGCVVPDNGSGTAELPPVGCSYSTPDDDMKIIDGLPPVTTIEIDASQGNFVCPGGGGGVCSFFQGPCAQPGGTLGGRQSCADATLAMPMLGTGALVGFNRFINLPLSVEVHTAPRVSGAPVQSFDTDMFRMFGQIIGDPDFDLLRVTAGSDFGLPSPGHTTLTQLGGSWAVDSFFDITYRIDFVGKPGGSLGGMSGSTTGTIRFRTGGSPSTCVGLCPPGTECRQQVTQNPDGTLDICCECVPIPCEPNPTGTACNPAQCPIEGEECRPRCARLNPFTGLYEVVACECVDPNSCHLEMTGGSGQGCVVPDNGSGTAELPPVGCSYSTPDDDMKIIDGLPPVTTIEIDASQGNFVCPGGGGGVCSFFQGPCAQPGGTLGGRQSCADATLAMPMLGTGALVGFNRFINLPLSVEVHTAPRVSGAPVQSFDTDMFRMFGQIIGDPDFDLLRVTAGTDFGLPSPGHTTLTQLPGGNWTVDSFFDITYRIDFVGRPGGALAGLSGSTTGTIRFAVGNAPQCRGICHPGTTCAQTVTVNPDGSITRCCECRTPPVITQWRSVRTHAGTPLSILLDATASGNGLTGPTVETRIGGIQQIEIDFDQPVVLVNPAAVSVVGRTTSYPGGLMGPATPYVPASVTLVAPTTLALTFLPGALPNRSCYQFDVAGAVENTASMALAGDPDCNARALVGDTTMSGGITLSDAIWTKLQIGTAAASLPEHDIDLSGGTIDIADALAAKGGVASPPRRALCP